MSRFPPRDVDEVANVVYDARILGAHVLASYTAYAVTVRLPGDATTVRCAHCAGYHFSAQGVRRCFADEQWREGEARREQDAERAYERYLEDRGWEDAYAQDQIEAQRGVVPFDVAYADALAALR